MDDAVSRRVFNQTLSAAALGGILPPMAMPAQAQTSGAGATTPGSADALCDLSAVELASRIKRKEVSAREVMAAHLARIDRVNPKVNAIVGIAVLPRHRAGPRRV